jgi:hypothetical protein
MVFILAVALISLASFELAGRRCPKRPPDNVVFQKEVGTWDTTTYTWPKGNFAPPTVYNGLEVNKLFSNSNRLHRTYTGTSSESLGTAKFTGNGLTLQFDANSTTYTGRWYSNTELKHARLEGKFDKKTNTLTLVYFAPPGKGAQYGEERHTTRYIDADTKEFSVAFVVSQNGKSNSFTFFKTIAKRKKP